MNRRQFLHGALIASVAIAASSRRVFAAPPPAEGPLADDLPNIQGMLDAAEKRGGGVVTLPEGRFRLAPAGKTPSLILPANVKLQGAGRDKTTLFMADGSPGHVVSAPYGYAQLSDLTIDGNRERRSGQPGHNLRIGGEKIVIERVRIANSNGYGIAVGQRNYARDITFRDVEVDGTATDGVDIKNGLGRTGDILFERVTVRRFGLLDEAKGAGSKAGIDLRGKCTLRDVSVYDVVGKRNGVRFRSGEADSPHGPGAHGSQAFGLTVRGDGSLSTAKGIAVVAREVQLEDVDIADIPTCVIIYADGLAIARGRLANASGAALIGRGAQFGAKKVSVSEVAFVRQTSIDFGDIEQALLSRCRFEDCRGALQAALRADPAVKLEDCAFDASCSR